MRAPVLSLVTSLLCLLGIVFAQELIQSGDTWTIFNAKSGTVMDLNMQDNTTVIGWALNNGPNQHWNTTWTGSHWNLQNQYTGSYLSIVGDVSDAGNGVALAGSPNPFDWDIWHDNDNDTNYRLYVPGTVFNLDLWDFGLSRNGNPITLWSAWNGTHQTWTFQKA
ncbi:hypothetical protein D9758_004364 [Tetrapyrgos nigripes]|uniref:Ricin B lectin domain-containing protein n=1 Tax=Tetrapyrgos nigripes TaxID=182062 RepID=A0A8H5GNK0_9AGAR|nr:hypothetical protein D9758_004364 [Tetrapyrgos nigripes]